MDVSSSTDRGGWPGQRGASPVERQFDGRARVLCKYFVHGACFKGDLCEFSHDWKDQASEVCTFYLKGMCSYGSRCRYQHVKSARPPVTVSPPVPAYQSVMVPAPEGSATDGRLSSGSAGVKTPLSVKGDVWQNVGEKLKQPFIDEEDEWGKDWGKELRSIDDPLCALAAAGICPRSDSCNRLHGDECQFCGKQCLHPFRTAEREDHLRQCERNQKRLESLCKSKEIECSVCLEKVLSKATVTERKFGLMSGCDHPFCVSCIRGWRSGSHPTGMDLDTVVRACPVCRKPSHYIIPSVTWYFSPEEKDEIVKTYKHRLRDIDCRYFDFGNGTCPFGTSCFYKHATKDGRIEEVKLRHLGAADGGTVIAKHVRLSDFLSNLDLGR